MSDNTTSGRMSDLDSSQHYELKELIGQLAAALTGREPDPHHAVPVLDQLTRALSHRFEREDDDFLDALQRAPWLTAGVLQLKQQHGQMLQIVGTLQMRMQAPDDSPEWSVDLGDQLEELADLLHEHAMVECSLLEESWDPTEWTLD